MKAQPVNNQHARSSATYKVIPPNKYTLSAQQASNKPPTSKQQATNNRAITKKQQTTNNKQLKAPH